MSGPRRTLPERLVADALRAFPEVEVREQVRVGRYRLDFLLGRLCLEIDGKRWHSPAHDQQRDAFLQERAIHVARLPTTEVLRLSPLGLIHRLDQLLREHEHYVRFP